MIIKKIKENILKINLKKIIKTKSVSDKDCFYISKNVNSEVTKRYLPDILDIILLEKNENLLNILIRNKINPNIKVNGIPLLNKVVKEFMVSTIDTIIENNPDTISNVNVHAYQENKIAILFHTIQKSELTNLTFLIENLSDNNDLETLNKIWNIIKNDDVERLKNFANKVIKISYSTNNFDFMIKSFSIFALNDEDYSQKTLSLLKNRK